MEALAYRQFLKLEQSHWWFIGRRRILFTLLDRHLAGTSGLKILDVGCGYGGMLFPLSKRGEVMGMEIDLEPARFCQERGFNAICLGSGYDLPFRTGSLDLITLFDTIEHIENDAKVIAECAGALKPGGLLMITVPAYPFLYADNDRIAHHYRRYRLSRLKRLVKAPGLEIVKATYFNVFLFPLIVPAILLLKIKQALRGPLKKEEAGSTNLSYRYPRPLRLLLETVFSFERHFLKRVSSPFGHSIALIARKMKP